MIAQDCPPPIVRHVDVRRAAKRFKMVARKSRNTRRFVLVVQPAPADPSPPADPPRPIPADTPVIQPGPADPHPPADPATPVPPGTPVIQPEPANPTPPADA